MTPEPLDAAALEKLRSLDPDGSRGFLAQILSTYEASLVKQLTMLAGIRTDAEALSAEPAATAADSASESRPAALDAVAASAHKLKSSSLSVGALVFARLCVDAERACQNVDRSEFLPALRALQAEGERVLSALRTMLKR